MPRKLSLITLASICIAGVIVGTAASKAPFLAVGLVTVLVALFVTVLDVQKTVIGLCTYFPFEGFVLKWLPQSMYSVLRYGSEFVIYYLAGYILVKKILSRSDIRFNLIDKLVVFFFGLSIISSVLGIVPFVVSLLTVRTVLRFMFLYFIVRNMELDVNFIRRLFGVLVTVLGIESIIAIVESIIGAKGHLFLAPANVTVGGETLINGITQPIYTHFYAMGTLGRYNLLGNFLAYFILISFASALFHRSRKIIWITILSVIALLLTDSRMSLMSLIIAGAFMIRSLNDLKLKARSVVIGGVVAIILIPLSIYLSNTSDHSIFSRMDRAFSASYIQQSSKLDRLYEVEHVAPKVIAKRPLFGLGPGALNSYVNVNSGGISAGNDNAAAAYLDIPLFQFKYIGDVGVVSLLFQFGLIGLATMILIFWVSVRWSLQLYKGSGDRFVSLISLGMGAALVAFAVQLLFSYNLTYRVPSLFCWLFIGLTSRLYTLAFSQNRCSRSNRDFVGEPVIHSGCVNFLHE